jgi:hypothetical protein
MSPTETWLFLLASAAVLALAVVGGGRAIDWMLDALWGNRSLDGVYRRERALRVMESWCPCEEDHDYHERAGQILSGPAQRVTDVALEPQDDDNREKE